MTDLPSPPVAARKPHAVSHHGVTIDDPYAWLRDPNYQEVLRDPSKLRADIRADLEAENAYSDAVLKPTRPLQEKLIAEMRGRIDPTSETAAEPAPTQPEPVGEGVRSASASASPQSPEIGG